MLTGILTFHASHNYGSMLQAYALQRYLLSKGYENEIINLRTDAQRNLYPHPLKINDQFLKWLSLFITPRWLYYDCVRWSRFEHFLKDRLILTAHQYNDWGSLRKNLAKYDVVITGGDQIWNLNCFDFNEAYYLPDPDAPYRKVSFAPSFGGMLETISTRQNSFIQSNLAGYDFISVREFTMKEYLDILLDRSTQITVDPVFLLSAEEYEPILGHHPLIRGDYLFYYSPRPNPKAEEYAIRLGKQFRLKVVTVMPHRIRRNGIRSFYGAGPDEFLNLVKHASIVVGQSYHLIAFALIFRKVFYAFEGNKDARIGNLLKYLGIMERGDSCDCSSGRRIFENMEFGQLDNQMNKLITSSASFLEQALSM